MHVLPVVQIAFFRCDSLSLYLESVSTVSDPNAASPKKSSWRIVPMSIRKYCLLVCLAATLATSAFGGVVVSAPANGATVSGSVQFIATAASPACAKGVASVGIYTAPYVLAYVTSGTQLNTTLSLNPG